MPTTSGVKKAYTNLMNKISAESGVSKGQKKKKRTDMTPAELSIDDEKRKLRKVYDCLMFTQCYS